MPDISTIWDRARLGGDWATLPPALAADCDLASSILISLFTWRRALPDDLLPEDAYGPGLDQPILSRADRRGWWGDTAIGQPIGSRLWLLAREKVQPDVLRRAKHYAEEALAWLVADGVAQSVTVQAETLGRDILALGIAVARPKKADFRIRFDWSWQNGAPCLPDGRALSGRDGDTRPPPALRIRFDNAGYDFSLTSLDWSLAHG